MKVELQYEKIIVLIIVLSSSFITWKMVKDFYIVKFRKVFAHIIAILTATFMLFSTMILFMPKNYQRGQTAEVELSLNGIVTTAVMLIILYVFFKYNSKNDKS